MSISDSVERWLPGLVRGHGNDGSKIKIRHLLQHTNGLFDYIFDHEIWSALSTAEAFAENRLNDYRPRRLARLAVSHRPSFDPGTGWEYSNTNYLLAGMVIKSVTGNSWGVEVRQRIIRLLHLTETTVPGPRPDVAWAVRPRL